MTPQEISYIVRTTVQTTLQELGLTGQYLSQAEAFRRFGRRKVQRWLDEGWLEYRNDERTGKKRFDRAEITAVAGTNNWERKFYKKPNKKQIHHGNSIQAN